MSFKNTLRQVTMSKVAAAVELPDSEYDTHIKELRQEILQREYDRIRREKEKDAARRRVDYTASMPVPTHARGVEPVGPVEEPRQETKKAPKVTRRSSKSALPIDPDKDDYTRGRGPRNTNRLPTLTEINKWEQEQRVGENEAEADKNKRMDEEINKSMADYKKSEQAKADKSARKLQLRQQMGALRREPKATTWGQLKNISLKDMIKGWTEGSFDLRGASRKSTTQNPRSWTKDVSDTIKQIPNVTLGEYGEQLGKNAITAGKGIGTGLSYAGKGIGTGLSYAGKGIASSIRAIREALKPRQKTFWEKLQDNLSDGYSRARKFIQDNPEFTFGAGGFLGGAGIGAALSPKNRLLGLLLGGIAGTGLGIGGKYLYDRYNA